MGWKLAPALSAGNTIIMKPSEITSLSILHWMEIVGEIMPPGVINVITGYGDEAGEEIVKHPKVPIITFTGSVLTGRRIAKIENLCIYPPAISSSPKRPDNLLVVVGTIPKIFFSK